MTKPICFLDMDGVLADFAGGLCRAHRRPWPYDDPANFGVFEIGDEIWKMSAREMWAPCAENPRFWEELDPTPDAGAIVEIAIEVFGADRIAILTAPSLDRECVPGKRRWVKSRFPFLAKRIVFASKESKKFLAGDGRVLIDDRNENCDEFEDFGGDAILLPRPWNRRHALAGDALGVLRKELELL